MVHAFRVHSSGVQGFMGSSLPYKIRKTMNDLSATPQAYRRGGLNI